MLKRRLAAGQMVKRAGGSFRSEQLVLVDQHFADDLLDGAVTDAGVKPVVVVGEGVHALGGFAGQLVDLGFDVFGGLLGGHGSFRPCWPRGHGRLVLEVLALERPNGVRSLSRFDVASFHFRGDAVSATRAAPAWGLRSGPPGPGRPLPPDDQGPHPYY